uniref:Uncharacterized protein n=1 Tax=Salix viminalis TaxID=40686 RepID=A0A6N2K0R7_SALVM
MAREIRLYQYHHLSNHRYPSSCLLFIASRVPSYWKGHYSTGENNCIRRLCFRLITSWGVYMPDLCFVVLQISNITSIWFIYLFLSIFATGVSAHLFAVFHDLLKVLAGIDTNFTVTSKSSDEDGDFAELYMFKWTTLLIPPTTLLIINLVGVVAGVSYAINSGYQSWGPLFGKLFFAFWVIIHLYPFLKGLMGRLNRAPTIIVVWSVLFASIFSLLWVRVDPLTTKVTGPDIEQCDINC